MSRFVYPPQAPLILPLLLIWGRGSGGLRYRARVSLLILGILAHSLVLAQGIPPNEAQTLGRIVPNTPLIDASGRRFHLHDLKGKPIILSPIYARCPSACVAIGNSLRTVLPQVGTPGKDFWVLSVTFDPKEGLSHIRAYQNRHQMDGYGWRAVYAENPKALFELLDAIDFRFTYISEAIKDHPNFIVVLSPELEIRAYVYGTEYEVAQVRKALRVARGKLTLWERFWDYWLAPSLVLAAVALGGVWVYRQITK